MGIMTEIWDRFFSTNKVVFEKLSRAHLTLVVWNNLTEEQRQSGIIITQHNYIINTYDKMVLGMYNDNLTDTQLTYFNLFFTMTNKEEILKNRLTLTKLILFVIQTYYNQIATYQGKLDSKQYQNRYIPKLQLAKIIKDYATLIFENYPEEELSLEYFNTNKDYTILGNKVSFKPIKKTNEKKKKKK